MPQTEKIRVKLLKTHFLNGSRKTRGNVIIVSRFVSAELIRRGVAEPVRPRK